MSQKATSDSYLVRIYRIDSDDPQQLAGQLEALDGRSVCTPFTSLAELAALLNPGARARGQRTRRPGKTDLKPLP